MAAASKFRVAMYETQVWNRRLELRTVHMREIWARKVCAHHQSSFSDTKTTSRTLGCWCCCIHFISLMPKWAWHMDRQLWSETSKTFDAVMLRCKPFLPNQTVFCALLAACVSVLARRHSDAACLDINGKSRKLVALVLLLPRSVVVRIA